LDAVVRATVARVDRVFGDAVRAFEVYPVWARTLPPLRALADSLRARQADLLYRLGRREAARRIWSDLLRADRLNPGLLKNLAVCDTGDPDPARTSASWRAFAEILYFYDVALADARRHARARAALHRGLGRAGVPTFLWDSKEGGRDRMRPLAAFLTSTGRVRHFVDHYLLEFLNVQFVTTSPLLSLGVSRSDPSKARAAAADRLNAFAEAATGPLPDRVREGFRALCARHFAEALAACKDPRRLLQTRDTAYESEKDEHLRRIGEVVSLKIALNNALNDRQTIAPLVREMTSVAFLEDLVRLDSIPLNLSEEFIAPVAGALKTSPDVVQGLLGNLCQMVMVGVMDLLFGKIEADDAVRQRQYRRLVERWVLSPALAELVPVIERPQHWYPEPALTALKTGKATAEAEAVLQKLCDQYPALTGIALDLAAILCTDPKRLEEAADLLDRVADAGFREEGRRRARRTSAQIRARAALEAEEFERAAEIVLRLLDEDEPDLQDPHLAISVFVEAARKRGEDPGIRDLRRALAGWVEKARGLLHRWDKSRGEAPFTDDHISTIQKYRVQITTEVVLTVAGLTASYREGGFVRRLLHAVGVRGEPDWARAEVALSGFIDGSEEVADARYYRMVARIRQANAAATARDSTRAWELLRAGWEDARAVKATGTDEQQEVASDVLGGAALGVALTLAGLTGKYRQGSLLKRVADLVGWGPEPDWDRAAHELTRLIDECPEPGAPLFPAMFHDEEESDEEIDQAAGFGSLFNPMLGDGPTSQPARPRSLLGDAYYYRMVARIQQANVAAKSRLSNRGYLESAKQDAQKVVKIGSPSQVKEAEDLIAQIYRALSH
jgi:hypothetical protein